CTRREDVLHRRGLMLGMAMAAVAIVFAGITGDNSARFIYQAQPAKFASMEGIYHTVRGASVHLGGIPIDSEQRVVGAIEIPKLLSLLAAFDPNAEVRGLDTFPSNDRPNPVLVHLSFDAMVGLGMLIGLAAALFWFLCIYRRGRVPAWRPLLWLIAISGPASVAAMEAGWFVTEFGRQPWIVYGILRTSEAATAAPALGPTFLVFFALYIGLAAPIALLGIGLRGAALACRAHGREAVGDASGWGVTFGAASVIAPFFMATGAAAVASGSVRVAGGQLVSGFEAGWATPYGMLIGLFAVAICAYLAATYLAVETEGTPLEADFRRRAAAAGLVAGVAAIAS